MPKILIGDDLIRPDDIESISERDVSFEIKKTKPNPKPKPKGLLGKAFYSSTIDVMEKRKYHVLVLKVAAGTQTILPDPDDDSDITIGSVSYGTHKLYNFYCICNDAKLISDAKAIKKEWEESNSDWEKERRAAIMQALKQLGMEMTFGGWVKSNYLDSSVMIDKDIKTKQDFIDKYM